MTTIDQPLPPGLDAARVVWTTPSRDSSGSMPLGNGDIGLNVWVEPSGDLCLYLAKTDAWDENGRLVKLGRVRLQFDPPLVAVPSGGRAASRAVTDTAAAAMDSQRGSASPSTGMAHPPDGSFRQELDLATGSIVVQPQLANRQPSPRDAEGSGRQSKIRLWVDAHAPVIRIEIEGTHARATFETWRTAPRPLEAKHEIHSAYGLAGGPPPVLADPDTVLVNKPDRALWCHRNERSVWPATMKLQSLADAPGGDPLLHRTFGGLLRVETRGDQQLVSVYLHTAQTGSIADWRRQLEALAARVDRTPLEQARAAHERWWREFWNRSWIAVSGDADAERVTRGYVRQRFVTACAGRGAYPIKFNGSLFTVDAREPNETFDADYRRWGGPYWFQNTRLIYWPLLMNGDFDLIAPWPRMFRDALPLAVARTRRYFGHGGACFPETMQFWGAYANENYGWDRAGKPAGHVDNTYIRHYWSGMLELVMFLLDEYEFTQDAQFLQETLLPLARPVIEFFDAHYPRQDEQGHRIFDPSQVLETWHEAVNPVCKLSGLHATLPRLLRLPHITAADRQRWTTLLAELPPVPLATENGQTRIVPALRYDRLSNMENPELYPVFPYRLYGVGRPGLEIALATFAHRRHKGTGGWQQDAIDAALLGLTDAAKRDVVQNFSTSHAGSRFDAFWGPNFDWIPDQDHGNVAMIALQRMVLQVDPPPPAGDRAAGAGKLRVLPAWPKEWDVAFKLHAPQQTVVEGVYRAGQLERLTVTPAARAADVVR